MSIEGQGHFFTKYFPGYVCFLCFTMPRYQVSVYRTIGPLVSLPEPKAHGELIVYQSSRRACVRPHFFKINISETSGSIATKFYLKHH